jgi:hypothetical protein
LEVTISVSEPIFRYKGEYVTINFKESDSLLLQAGKPVLPVFIKTLTFPCCTEIVDVKVDLKSREYILNRKIQPAPKPVFNSESSPLVMDESTYTSSNFYPAKAHTFSLGIGLKGEDHVLYLNIYCYPQYSPAKNLIRVPTKISIQVVYIPSRASIVSTRYYDMLIITDEKFALQLQRLVEHKNSIGIRTVLETTQSIYPKYNGRDEAEDIKLRIKDAIEQWGIKYVLLAGGRKGQTFEWYIPERRSNNDDGSGYESGYSSDLYFADIYRYRPGGPIFEDWDSNRNGVFAEFYGGIALDKIDYYPDVWVGRIPLRYSWEVDVVVNKIIEYERGNNSWFKRALVVSGDTSPPARGQVRKGIYEGELSTAITAKLLESVGFEVKKLWTSDGTFTCKEDVILAVSEGHGFIHFEGHGNAASWGNFLPDAEKEPEEFVYGFGLLDMRKFKNGDRLPIVMIGGCHNAQFNVTMQYLIEGLKEYGFEYLYSKEFAKKEWVPTDTCSWFLLEEGGGAIASIGNTGLGYGYINEYCTEGLGGWINPRFFHAYAKQNKHILGEAHGQAIIDYINRKGSLIEGVNVDSIDRKTIEEWALIGDPSLRIGGGV